LAPSLTWSRLRLSILAEPAVAVVDKNVDKKGTRAVATAYLEYLYTEEGQDIAGKNFYRPAVSEKAKAKYAKQFPKINLFTIDQGFGGWEKADKAHFADGGSFDQIYTKSKLNVSYDVAREFYKDYNAAFAAHYKKTTGRTSRSTSRTPAPAPRRAP
jgi:ABC-type sulfate transport system substrate-binding protein